MFVCFTTKTVHIDILDDHTCILDMIDSKLGFIFEIATLKSTSTFNLDRYLFFIIAKVENDVSHK